MPLYDFRCRHCGAEIVDLKCQSKDLEDNRPTCCYEPMRTKISVVAIKSINYNPATQTGEENARMCGVDV